jgi:hypothetical protein
VKLYDSIHIKLHAPLNFSIIPRYLNKCPPPRWDEHILRLYGDTHLDSQHVSSLIDFILDYNVVHDDIRMIMFAHTLKEDAKDWF